jgi:hypothetical protein
MTWREHQGSGDRTGLIKQGSDLGSGFRDPVDPCQYRGSTLSAAIIQQSSRVEE